MLTMNEKDKNEMLEAILKENRSPISASYGRSSWPELIPMH